MGKVGKGENCNELESSAFLNSRGLCMEIRRDESRFYLKPFIKKKKCASYAYADLATIEMNLLQNPLL